MKRSGTRARTRKSSRRQFLAAAAAVTGAALFPGRSSAQRGGLEIVRLAGDIIAVIGRESNAVAVNGADGIVMVDGGDADWSAALLRAVGETFSPKPVQALFNTHWHPEHTGSNLAVGEQGGQIIAHENTALWLGTEVWVRWSDMRYPPLPQVARPTLTFYESGSFELAERSVECGWMPKAHTDGDIWVFFPEENVLAAGGVVSNDGWPIIDWWTGGWIVGMLDGLESLLEVANEHTRIVPGKGPVMSLADLEAQYEMYLTIYDRVSRMFTSAFSTDEVLAARPTAEYDAAWGDPELFVTLAFHSLRGHLRNAHDTRFRAGA